MSRPGIDRRHAGAGVSEEKRTITDGDIVTTLYHNGDVKEVNTRTGCVRYYTSDTGQWSKYTQDTRGIKNKQTKKLVRK